MTVLLRPELAIGQAALHQLLMRADIHDLALLHHQDLVAIDQGGQSVRDDHHRPAAGDAEQIGVDHRLALGIERAGRLVQDQDPWIVDQGAGDGDALALAA